MTKKPRIYFASIYEAPNHYKCVGILSNGIIFGETRCSKPGWASVDLYFSNPHIEQALEKAFGISREHVQNNHEHIQFYSVGALLIWFIARVATPSQSAIIDRAYKKYNHYLSGGV